MKRSELLRYLRAGIFVGSESARIDEVMKVFRVSLAASRRWRMPHGQR